MFWLNRTQLKVICIALLIGGGVAATSSTGASIAWFFGLATAEIFRGAMGLRPYDTPNKRDAAVSGK